MPGTATRVNTSAWALRLVFTQLAQAQNPGEALSSFLEVVLNLKHIHSSVFLRHFFSLRKA